MNIFISYSTEDLLLVNQIADYLKHHAKVRYWEKDKVPGEKDWEQIYEWIEESEIFLVVITDNAVTRAMSVGIEIGYAKDHDAKIIPLVATNVKNSELGCLQGITQIRIDAANLGPALQQLEVLVKQLKRQDLVQSMALLGGIIAFVWLTSKSK